MSKRSAVWAKAVRRNLRAGTRAVVSASKRALTAQTKAPSGAGDWLAGVAIGAAGARRYRLYRPPGIQPGERLPLLLMLHGCGQTANGFALSTRMNTLAAGERFCVLYPEQDRLANAQGCWNWFDTTSRRAFGELALIMAAVDQVAALYRVDTERVAVAGFSAGASMAALLVTCHSERFKALVMHSGIPPGTANSSASAVGAMRGRRATQALAVSTENWPPLLVIHGQRDAVVSPNNGRAAVQQWADAAGAQAGTPRLLQRGQRYPVSLTEFKRAARVVATLAEVAGLGHAWSGGAASQPFSDPQGPDASRMVWRFVVRQFVGA